jgi:3-hydroxybutyryl-CoA dehydrogenase
LQKILSENGKDLLLTGGKEDFIPRPNRNNKKPHMKLIICATKDSKNELLAQDFNTNITLHWIEKPEDLSDRKNADGFIDLDFDGTRERIALLKELEPVTVIVNSVITTLKELPKGFVRINGWNGFLKRSLIEASGNDEKKEIVAEIFSHFNRRVEWIPDVIGFVSARIISMIINEAYFGLEEKVSTKEEIDTAMKLGTNYPYGPFEWSEKIGLKNIYELLKALAKTESRYEPAALLKAEALKQ